MHSFLVFCNLWADEAVSSEMAQLMSILHRKKSCSEIAEFVHTGSFHGGKSFGQVDYFSL